MTVTHETSANDKSRALPTAIALAVIGLTPAVIYAQHVHGVIDLGVVIEGNTLSVTVDAPLSDVVGFEHAPDNEAQTAELKRVAAILADADAMFGVPATAGCKIADTAIIAPAYLDSMVTAAAGHDHDDGREEHDHGEHDHDNDKHDHGAHDHGKHDHDEHDHDEHDHGEHDHGKHDHDEHDHDQHDHDAHDHDKHDHDDHDHGSGHAEVNATYQWTCGDAAELSALDLRFSSEFVSVEAIRVQLLSADGARVMNLSREDRSLPLSGR